MLTLLFILLSQNDGLGVLTVEAQELLEQKPKVTYQLPEWVSDEYLFELSGFPLDAEIERYIDATILTSQLGGKPLDPSMSSNREDLFNLHIESVMNLLAMQVGMPLEPELTRQILMYRVVGDWLANNLSGVDQTISTLQADAEASSGVDFVYLSTLIDFWKKGSVATTSDSLLHFLFVNRNPSRALDFLPEQGEVRDLLRYHLDENTGQVPSGNAGRFLNAHRLLQDGQYQAAADSFAILADIKFPYQALARYDEAQALLAMGDFRQAHLAVPDSFHLQWLLPQSSLALTRGRKEWLLGRETDARRWFRISGAIPAFDLFASWVMAPPNYNNVTRGEFLSLGAGDLYDILIVTGYLKQAQFNQATPLLENLLVSVNISSSKPNANLILGLYTGTHNQLVSYQQTLRLAETVRARENSSATGTRDEDYFLTAAHLAIADAYYYSGGRYFDKALPFYEYCAESYYPDLRHFGLFGLGWAYIGSRELDEVPPILSSLRAETLNEWERQLLVFFEGLFQYAKRDFAAAAGTFSQLNFSAIPEMQMQGLYFQGRSWEQIQGFEKAAQAYDELLDKFPDIYAVRDAWTRLGHAQVELGQLDAAEETLNRLMRQGKLLHFDFGDLYREILLMIYDASMRQGREDQAREIAERLSRTQNSSLPLETYYYRVAEKCIDASQANDLSTIIYSLDQANPSSVYLPDLLLKLARMEIELEDYHLAIGRLERILQWPNLADVNHMLTETYYELIRASVLAKDWDKTILHSQIFIGSNPDLAEYTPRVLFFRAYALIERAGASEAFARKEDAQQAMEALDLLEREFSSADFVKESSADIESLRRSAAVLLQ